MKAKQVIDFKVSKGITVAQSDEHQRRWSERGWKSAMAKGNYDPTRQHLNFEIVKGEVRLIDKSRSIPELMRDNLKARGIADPNEGLEEPRFRTVVSFIFGGSRERMHELAFGDQKVSLKEGADNSTVTRREDIENWARDVYSFVAEKYGEENIVAFYVHLDETNPHVHCTLLPIRDGKFAYKQIFAGKDKMEFSRNSLQLHTEFAEVSEKWGMERGTSITETGARHRSTEEYRRWLDEACLTTREELENCRRALEGVNAEIRIAERRVKGLTTMIENAEREKRAVEQRIGELTGQLNSGMGDRLRLQNEIQDLRVDLHSLEEKLADKRQKLQTADTRLSQLQNDMEKISAQNRMLRSENAEAAAGVEERAKSQLSMAMLEMVANEFHFKLRSLDEETEEYFDDTLLKDMAERGNAVMKCALMLYVGFIDQATTFAQGHGGGGGGSSMPWGRDADEDDRRWARRCAQMAQKMMRPIGVRKTRR